MDDDEIDGKRNYSVDEKLASNKYNKSFVVTDLKGEGRGSHITLTCPCNLYPRIPHFYITKLGYAGVILFLIFVSKHRLWVLVRVPTIYVLSKNKKNKKKNLMKIFNFYNLEKSIHFMGMFS